ncbi:hypothetical protein [Lichenihabitans psoromatis]|uniref:hypothetical protein n=1 Tax=Lichenihabitans psoromatis TaxID=2528642 RepID=UPI0010361A56|nr:hypothetical protein [Lichenihabitans psoromatis]
MELKKHFGTLEEFKAIVSECGKRGIWSEIPKPHRFRFKSQKGQIVNWWPQNGTVQVQGADSEAFELRLRQKLQSGKGGRAQLRPKEGRRPSLPRSTATIQAALAAAKKTIADALGCEPNQIRIVIEP